MTLTARDLAGAISELSARSDLVMSAVAELAAKTGHVPAQAQLSDTDALEVERITLTHGGMFRPSPADLETSGSYEDEVLRLTSVSPDLFYSSSSRRRSAAARRQADAQTLALSRSTAEPAQGQLVSKYGLPISYAGQPVLDTPANRIAFGRVLPPMVADVTDDPSVIDPDIVGTLGRRAQGLGVSPDTDPDLGPDVSGWGEQTEEYSNPGVVADPAAEVSRLIQQHGSAVTGLRAGATKNRHPKTGRFTSPQARLTGTLSGI